MIGDEHADRDDHQHSIKTIQTADEFPVESTVLAAEIFGHPAHPRLLMDEGEPS
jgi:hypothetical protein